MPIHDPQRDVLETWSINTAANLMNLGFEPIEARRNGYGRPVIVFPPEARPALHRLHACKARAAEMLGADHR
jgi:hypothetical protein